MQDVIEEAADWALSHPPNPISKREVPKTNRCRYSDHRFFSCTASVVVSPELKGCVIFIAASVRGLGFDMVDVWDGRRETQVVDSHIMSAIG